MMKRLSARLRAVIVVFLMVLGVVAFSVSTTHALTAAPRDGTSIVNDGSSGSSFQTVASNVISTILFALGMIAVVMIVIGGFNYVTSNGDSGKTQTAKNTILYAVIGLIVAILSFAIVNFVLGRF